MNPPRRPPKRLFRHRPDREPSAARRFREAMLVEILSEHAAEVRAGRSPCWLCGGPGTHLGVWWPTARYSHFLGAPPGMTRCALYVLCKKCLGRPDSGRRVEDVILRNRQIWLAAVAAGLEIEDGFIPFGSEADAARFSAAFDRNAPPV